MFSYGLLLMAGILHVHTKDFKNMKVYITASDPDTGEI